MEGLFVVGVVVGTAVGTIVGADDSQISVHVVGANDPVVGTAVGVNVSSQISMHLVGEMDCDGLSEIGCDGLSEIDDDGLSEDTGAIDGNGLSINIVGVVVGLSGDGGMTEGRSGLTVGMSVGKVVGVNVSTQISGGPRSPKHSSLSLSRSSSEICRLLLLPR